MNKAVKPIAVLMALVLTFGALAACGVQPAASPEAAPTEEPAAVEAPAVTEAPAADPTEAPAAEPEDERIVKEDYVFEGPGIITPADYPEGYKQEAAQRGTVIRHTYNNGVEEKYFLVYLPYGYESSSEKYNVLYLMHGGNGRPEVYLNEQSDRPSVGHQKLIDNMIQNGDVEPFIFVAPTWNSTVTGQDTDGSHSGSGDLTKQFAETEFATYVMPIVDSNYRTNATREGRAFGGFSMGGVTTWYIFMYDLEYVKYFVPISGDCWISDEKGGGSDSADTAQALADAVSSQGYTDKDFKIYCFTGTQDIAMPNLAPQIYAMQENEMFKFGENTFFGPYLDATHIDTITRAYLYTALPQLWQD